MPGPTIPAAVREVRRQVRRVRWRSNAHQLLRAILQVASVTAATALGLLLFALGSRTETFAAAAVSAFLVAGGALGLVLRSTHRRWLSAARAPTWIDREGGLRGRVASALELARALRTEAPLLPLLVEQATRSLPSWCPRRLVPCLVPRRELLVAASASLVLALTWLAGTLLGPPLPGIATLGLAGSAGGRPAGDPRSSVPLRASHDEPAAEPSTLMRVAAAVQAQVQTALWGEEWRRVAEALAAADAEAGGMQPDADSADVASGSSERAPLDRRTGGRGRESAPAEAPGIAVPHAVAGDGGTPSAAAPTEADEVTPTGALQGARGAGTGTSPDLFGAARDGGAASVRAFELGLAARVRGPRDAPRPPSGEAPPPGRDAHPTLAETQHPTDTFQRRAVPPRYEPIVRELFARGAQP